MPQAFVEKLILHAVREGHQVVHLKGGSSDDFSSMHQEFESLVAAGVATQMRIS
jgi:siroheme synthase